MAGEIQLNSTTFATESSGTITVSNVDSATNRQNLGLEIGVDVQQYDADTTKNDVANTFTANQIISVTDNTNAALRVTQLGTGNALVVEDSTNPDSTPFVVDSSGNVGIGTSSPGVELEVDGNIRTDGIYGQSDTNTSIQFPGSDVITFNEGGSEAMRINSDGQLIKNGDSTSARIIPETDTVGYIGTASKRWNEIYASNGTIQTSDETEKQDIESLSDAELRVANAVKSLIKKFRFKKPVIEKGDDARIHVGVIAQEVRAAFEAEGLDANRYGMFCSDTWWENSETYTDDEGIEQTRTNTYDTAEEAPEGAVERTRLGVRYSELLAFMIAAI